MSIQEMPRSSCVAVHSILCLLVSCPAVTLKPFTAAVQPLCCPPQLHRVHTALPRPGGHPRAWLVVPVRHVEHRLHPHRAHHRGGALPGGARAAMVCWCGRVARALAGVVFALQQ